MTLVVKCARTDAVLMLFPLQEHVPFQASFVPTGQLNCHNSLGCRVHVILTSLCVFGEGTDPSLLEVIEPLSVLGPPPHIEAVDQPLSVLLNLFQYFGPPLHIEAIDQPLSVLWK